VCLPRCVKEQRGLGYNFHGMDGIDCSALALALPWKTAYRPEQTSLFQATPVFADNRVLSPLPLVGSANCSDVVFALLCFTDRCAPWLQKAEQCLLTPGDLLYHNLFLASSDS
jgi:hypothetical protein